MEVAAGVEMASVMAAMARGTTIEMAAAMASSVTTTGMASGTTIESAAAMEVWWYRQATQEYWVCLRICRWTLEVIVCV